MFCGGLLVSKVPEGEKAAIAPCPACGREIKLPFSDEALKNEEAREALYRYGRAVARKEKKSVALFTFKVNDKVIMADPECGCAEESDCIHNRMVIVFSMAQ